MNYFLISMIIIAVVAILYVWYVTRGTHTIPDDKPLLLDTDEDKILVHWYNLHTKPSYDFNVDDCAIAAKYIHRIYNLEVNPNNIVVGTNLDAQYYTLTNNHLESKPSLDHDYLVDLRSLSAKSGEIAVINDPVIRTKLERANSLDLTALNLIIESDLDIIAKEYLDGVLKARWELIQKLNDPNIANNDGSYLYLNLSVHPNNYPQGNSSTVLDNVTAKFIMGRARINLLCSNYEFEALLKRWRKHLTSVV